MGVEPNIPVNPRNGRRPSLLMMLAFAKPI
jgi:hypothetical protein